MIYFTIRIIIIDLPQKTHYIKVSKYWFFLVYFYKCINSILALPPNCETSDRYKTNIYNENMWTSCHYFTRVRILQAWPKAFFKTHLYQGFQSQHYSPKVCPMHDKRSFLSSSQKINKDHTVIKLETLDYIESITFSSTI